MAQIFLEAIYVSIILSMFALNKSIGKIDPRVHISAHISVNIHYYLKVKGFQLPLYLNLNNKQPNIYIHIVVLFVLFLPKYLLNFDVKNI
jgi:hypothetical protein